jgi:hypothetical protein
MIASTQWVCIDLSCKRRSSWYLPSSHTSISPKTPFLTRPSPRTHSRDTQKPHKHNVMSYPISLAQVHRVHMPIRNSGTRIFLPASPSPSLCLHPIFPPVHTPNHTLQPPNLIRPNSPALPHALDPILGIDAPPLQYAFTLALEVYFALPRLLGRRVAGECGSGEMRL